MRVWVLVGGTLRYAVKRNGQRVAQVQEAMIELGRDVNTYAVPIIININISSTSSSSTRINEIM